MDSERTPCLWYQDGEDSDTWAMGCGGYFSLDQGTPIENDMRFCCKCGKPLEELPHTTEDDAQEAGDDTR